MSKFYVGQPVRIGDVYDDTYPEGSTVFVTEVETDPNYTGYDYRISGSPSDPHGWLVMEEEIAPIYTDLSDLEVGDRVMIIGTVPYQEALLGEKATVSRERSIIITDKPFSNVCWDDDWQHKYIGGPTKVVKLPAEKEMHQTITLGAAPSIADDLRLGPQARTVLAHLKMRGHITHLEAQTVYGVWSVSSRISELKAAGYKINKQNKRDGQGKRYVAYSLVA